MHGPQSLRSARWTDLLATRSRPAVIAFRVAIPTGYASATSVAPLPIAHEPTARLRALVDPDCDRGGGRCKWHAATPRAQSHRRGASQLVTPNRDASGA